MQFPVPAFTTFVIPTGATTGSRIVFNPLGNGSILVYDSANRLIASVAPANGDDGQGNNFQPVLTTYDRNNNLFVNLVNGSAFFGQLVGGSIDTGTAGSIGSIFPPVGTAAPELDLQAPTDATNNIPTFIELRSGQVGAGIGSPNTPNMILPNTTVGTTDMGISGAIYKIDPNSGALNSPLPWQTPAFNVLWTGSTALNGNVVASLRYRLDAENNLMISGAFAAQAVAPVNPVFTLPVGFRPAQNMLVFCVRNNAGAITTGAVQITTAGNVNVNGSLGLGIVANNQYYIEGTIALGDLP